MTTKKSVRYRPGNTGGGNNCERCRYFTGTTWWCSVLEVKAKPYTTCDRFESNPRWKNPYASNLERLTNRRT